MAAAASVAGAAVLGMAFMEFLGWMLCQFRGRHWPAVAQRLAGIKPLTGRYRQASRCRLPGCRHPLSSAGRCRPAPKLALDAGGGSGGEGDNGNSDQEAEVASDGALHFLLFQRQHIDPLVGHGLQARHALARGLFLAVKKTCSCFSAPSKHRNRPPSMSSGQWHRAPPRCCPAPPAPRWPCCAASPWPPHRPPAARGLP